jgi:hypothetical protein
MNNIHIYTHTASASTAGAALAANGASKRLAIICRQPA